MKLLMALSRFPLPARKGDKLRAWQQIQGLSQTFDIYLVCLADELPDPADIDIVRAYVRDIYIIHQPAWKRMYRLFLALFNGLPFQVAYFTSCRMRRQISLWLKQEQIDLCYVQLVRLGESIPYLPKVRYFLDYMDALSGGMQNRVPLSNGIRKLLFAWEARRLRKYEHDISFYYQGYSVITSADANLLPEITQSRICIIPNGVQERFFLSVHKSEHKEKFDLIFTGNMAYFPNVQAAIYLVKNVLPLLLKELPGISICLAGTDPSPEVLSLAGPQVKVTGYVEDMAEVIVRAKIYVAPLFTGSGLQNKLLEAMALGLPVITSPLANEALGALPGEEIEICNTPEAFARSIIQFCTSDAEKASHMGMKGRAFVSTHYRWQAANAKLTDCLLKLADRS